MGIWGTNSSTSAVRLVPGLDVRAGQLVAGKYRVEERLGSGPAGVVLTARHAHMRDPVTLKILASYTDGQEELLARRIQRARIAARLRSEHIARIVEIGVTTDGFPFIATERLEGSTLEAELDARGVLRVDEAVRWILEAAEGLAEAHAAGLVHGDLKPSNLFLAKPRVAQRSRERMRALQPSPVDDGRTTASDDPRVLKILDFGMTSPLEALGDRSATAFFGSPAYLAPEQIQDPGSVDARADVWALGVCLYELLSGELPFTADTLSGVLVAVAYDAPALLTDAPYDLAKIVHQCLHKERDKRPRDVEELAAMLAPFAGERGSQLWGQIRVTLAAPPRRELENAMRDASASGSVPPVSMSVVPPDEAEIGSADTLPLVTRRGRRQVGGDLEDPTRPSQRVLARRRRLRATALAVTGVAAVVAAIGIGAAPDAPASSRAVIEPPVIPDRKDDPIAPVVPVQPDTTPTSLPDAPATPPAAAEEPTHEPPPRVHTLPPTHARAAGPLTHAAPRHPVRSGDLRRDVHPPPPATPTAQNDRALRTLFNRPK